MSAPTDLGQSGVSPVTVLLVEDNPLDARSVQRALGQGELDVGVHHVPDLTTARQVCQDQAFDAILLDLSLPDSEGLNSLSTLQQDVPATPIIVLTGLTDPQVALTAVENGAQDFLNKGTITPELIERALRYAIARHHSESELRRARVVVESMHTREEIARDLHDTVIQRLFATGMSLQAASGLASREELVERVGRAVDEIDASISELRHAIFGLHNAPVSSTLATEIDAIVARHLDPASCSAAITLADVDLGDGLRRDLIAITEEALSNVAQHAQANHVQIEMVDLIDSLQLSISDDGAGSGSPHAGAPATEPDILRGRGTSNMNARAEQYGGNCTISNPSTGGTRIVVTIPAPPGDNR